MHHKDLLMREIFTFCGKILDAVVHWYKIEQIHINIFALYLKEGNIPF